MTPTVGGLNTSSDSGSSGSSGNNNTKLNPVTENPGDQNKRTVNFKLEIKQDPEKQESDMCKQPQKVPSISDLSETESSLDLPTHQVRTKNENVVRGRVCLIFRLLSEEMRKCRLAHNILKYSSRTGKCIIREKLTLAFENGFV